jgi:hypothetical protein
MLRCGGIWQPSAVTRVIETLMSSTRVVKVATDIGAGFLKGMGNPQGNESLASELVGSELAAMVGLKVPPFAIVEVADLPIQMSNGHYIDRGPAFISQALKGSTGDSEGTFLSRLANPEDIPLLVALDTWIRNMDRCPPEDYLDPTPKWDNIFFAPNGRRFDMIVFDHTHCFVEGTLGDGLAGSSFVDDTRVFGLFPQFEGFLTEENLREACANIAAVDENAIRAVVHSIPEKWGPTQSLRDRWAELIIQRGQRLTDYLTDALIRQQQIGV